MPSQWIIGFCIYSVLEHPGSGSVSAVTADVGLVVTTAFLPDLAGLYTVWEEANSKFEGGFATGQKKRRLFSF